MLEPLDDSLCPRAHETVGVLLKQAEDREDTHARAERDQARDEFEQHFQFPLAVRSKLACAFPCFNERGVNDWA